MSDSNARIEGYVAADIIIEELMNDAKEKLEPYAKREGKKIDWWRGYREGLLSAHCMMVLGKFPEQLDNGKQIVEAMERYNKRREAQRSTYKMKEKQYLVSFYYDAYCQGHERAFEYALVTASSFEGLVSK